MKNTEISERKARILLARDGFEMLSRALLSRYIADRQLSAPIVRAGRKYFKLADIERLLREINCPTPIVEKPVARQQKSNDLRPRNANGRIIKSFRNAGYE